MERKKKDLERGKRPNEECGVGIEGALAVSVNICLRTLPVFIVGEPISLIGNFGELTHCADWKLEGTYSRVHERKLIPKTTVFKNGENEELLSSTTMGTTLCSAECPLHVSMCLCVLTSDSGDFFLVSPRKKRFGEKILA